MIDKLKNNHEKQYFIIAIFILILYAVVGLFLFDDYGCGPDEGMERQTALVNLKYVVHKLHIPISEQNETWLGYLPELQAYRDRFYGTALHFPLVLIESAFHFTLEPSQFYGMRHFYTFLNYYVGVICLYKLLSRRFGSRKYGITGMLMMILFPRFFAESFYNNKDVIFVSWYIICIFLMDRWFKKQNFRNTVLLAFALALTCNTRFNGIIFLPVLFFLYLFDCLRKRKTEGKQLFYLMFLLTFLFFYLITPNFWESPVKTLSETLQFNLRHPNHGSEGNLFKGVLVDAARTLTYIPTWIIITIPSVYLLFTAIGTCFYITDTFLQVKKKTFENIDLTDVSVFICGFGAVIFIILAHVTIYNGWRHCYFAYPCFVYFAIYFLKRINAQKMRIAIITIQSILYISFVYNLIWIINNHPYEYVYFAPVFNNSANQFSGDYWSISSRSLLEYIVEYDPNRMIKINHMHSQAGSINRGLFSEEIRRFIELTYDQTQDVDYYIICRDDIPSLDIKLNGYEKVYSIFVDKDEIGAVFSKSADQ